MMILNNNYILSPIAYIKTIQEEEVKALADCFRLNKYQCIDENVLYDAMILYKLLDKPKHIDILFNEYIEKTQMELSINIERLLYLSLTMLFATGTVEKVGHLIKRRESDAAK